MHFFFNFFLKSFGGLGKSSTFASANEETTSEALKKEFFERFT